MTEAFERTTSFEQPTAKRVHIATPLDLASTSGIATTTTTTTTNAVPLGERSSTFGDNAQRVRSYQEEAAVPSELRSKLESIGMRTRFNVNRGYGVQPTTTAAGFPSGALLTEREILHHVNANRSAFARTQSAPLYANELQPFAGNGMRPMLPPSAASNDSDGSLINENEDPLAAAFFDDVDESGAAHSITSSQNSTSELKRSRDLYDDDDDVEQHAFNMSVARQGGSASLGATRLAAATLPVSAGLSSYMASNSIFPASQTNAWTQHDFSTYSQADNF